MTATALLASVLIHGAVWSSGLADWLLGLVLPTSAKTTEARPDARAPLEVTFVPLPEMKPTELPLPDAADDPARIEPLPPKRIPLHELGRTFVFVPDERPRAPEAPRQPTELVSDRDLLARNPTAEPLSPGEAFTPGTTEHDVLQVEPPGTAALPGIQTDFQPTPPDILERPADNDRAELQAKDDREQEGRQIEQDIKKPDPHATRDLLGTADAAEPVIDDETAGERTIKLYGSRAREKATVADRANPGRNAEKGIGEDLELERILKALSARARQPVPRGGERGVVDASLVIHKNEKSRSSSQGDDEVDAHKHPLGRYMGRLVEDVGRQWRSRARVERLSNLPGQVVVRFVVQKDGRLTAAKVAEKDKSFKGAMEEAICVKAIRAAAPYEPLPRDFDLEELKIQFTFIYE